MTTTIRQLNEYIERLKADLEAAEERANTAEHELEQLKENIADGRATWAQPIDWEEKSLPVPRLELHWIRESDYDSRCLYVLVYRHFLDGAGNGPKIVAKPLGLTRRHGSSAGLLMNGQVDTPFRESAHAWSDAAQLALPLYVTTDAGDADRLVHENGERKHVVIARAA